MMSTLPGTLRLVRGLLQRARPASPLSGPHLHTRQFSVQNLTWLFGSQRRLHQQQQEQQQALQCQGYKPPQTCPALPASVQLAVVDLLQAAALLWPQTKGGAQVWDTAAQQTQGHEGLAPLEGPIGGGAGGSEAGGHHKRKAHQVERQGGWGVTLQGGELDGEDDESEEGKKGWQRRSR